MGYFILVNPKEAKVKDTVQVCYDFEASGQTGSVTIHVTYYGWGEQTLTLTPSTPCGEITVPIGCTGILLEDMTGGSGDAAVTVI